MDTPALENNPLSLPAGTQVGAWRLLGFQGRGVYGTVYSAVSTRHPHAKPVALKLAIYPEDPRFEREAELLSRVRHPCVPRLLDSGLWRSSSGSPHPFLVMERVDGEPLYSWASRRNPSSRQVLALLAQAARALQATHEVSGVHRDVKGDNMLVRPSDGRLFLTDFGSAHFAGAARLTPLPMLPGTPAYRSPQVWQCLLRAGLEASSPLLAKPSDDVFALGVTAYRLVTDSYPPFTHPHEPQAHCWQPGGSGPQPPRQLSPRVDAQLNALILRMLSPTPEERGTAGELAEALERGVAHAGPSADAPLFDWETQPPSEWTQQEQDSSRLLGHRPRHRDRQRALDAEHSDATARSHVQPTPTQAPAPATARHAPRTWQPWLAALLALALCPSHSGSVRTVRQLQPPEDTVSLGDSALNQAPEPRPDSAQKAIVLEVPKTPRPGQLRPDKKGRCPDRQIAIHGACWAKVDLSPEHCHGNVFTYQGGCYMPINASEQVPTSAPTGK
ncbi:MAG TPA: serine/threonine-protein kinase [Myxococcaceae bacterium]|nr:serine/threonine-protein kinase [Myxococcaceae bacterium]